MARALLHGLPVARDAGERLVAALTMAHQIAAGDRAGAADAAPAVDADGVARSDSLIDPVEDGCHELRRARQAQIAYRHALVHDPPAIARMGWQQMVVGRQLAFLGQVDEAGDAAGEVGLQALAGDGVVPVAGILAGQQTAG